MTQDNMLLDFDSDDDSPVGVAVEEAPMVLDEQTVEMAGRRVIRDLEAASAAAGDVAAVAGTFADMPDKLLITALVGVKGITKAVKTVEEALKDAVKSRHQPMKSVVIGGEETLAPENKKVIIAGEGAAKVELRPKRSVTFNPEVATVVLRRKGLLAAATLTTVTVTDPAALHTKLKEAQAALIAVGNTDLAIDIGVVLKTAVTTRSELSEDLIEGLVKAEKLTLTETAAFFDEKVDHSVYDVSK